MITKACKPTDLSADSRATAAARFAVGAKARRAHQFLGNDEPSLDDLLADDVLKRLMARDGVAAEQLRQLADHISV